MTKTFAPNFETWLLSAMPGDMWRYHRGLLMRDRQFAGDAAAAIKVKAIKLDQLADKVWEAYESGKVSLTQLRHGYSDYSYLAIRNTAAREMQLCHRRSFLNNAMWI